MANRKLYQFYYSWQILTIDIIMYLITSIRFSISFHLFVGCGFYSRCMHGYFRLFVQMLFELMIVWYLEHTFCLALLAPTIDMDKIVKERNFKQFVTLLRLLPNDQQNTQSCLLNYMSLYRSNHLKTTQHLHSHYQCKDCTDNSIPMHSIINNIARCHWSDLDIH